MIYTQTIMFSFYDHRIVLQYLFYHNLDQFDSCF